MSTEEKKKKDEKKKIVFLLTIIGATVAFLLWKFLFSAPPIVEVDEDFEEMGVRRNIPEIDFEYLQGEEFEKFHDYHTIETIDLDLLGRDNPFLPY